MSKFLSTDLVTGTTDVHDSESLFDFGGFIDALVKPWTMASDDVMGKNLACQSAIVYFIVGNISATIAIGKFFPIAKENAALGLFAIPGIYKIQSDKAVSQALQG